MGKTIKCKVDGNFVNPCKRLIEASEYGNPTGKKKGIFGWLLFVNTKPSRRFFGVKSGNYVASGIAFNFCPFCGTQIDEPFLETNEVDLSKGE